MKKSHTQNGYSLIELLIVLVVLSITVTLALSTFKDSKTSFRRQNFARELKVSLERARSDSIKRRATDENKMAYVKITSPTSFILSSDLNQNQTLESNEDKTSNMAGSNIKIVGSNLIFPITVRFDRRGFMTATNGAANEITPSFIVCENCLAATADSTNSNIISVSPTGTVSMFNGGQDAPVFQNPNLSIVSGGSQINSTAVVTSTP
jgi:prepilin-type N-terminal cleavage/methylation domain-containing protein